MVVVRVCPLDLPGTAGPVGLEFTIVVVTCFFS